MGKKRPLFVAHELTERAVKVLSPLQKGDVITWDKLSKAIGMDAQSDGKHYIASARRILLRENSAVFDAVVGVGVKRLTDKEIASRPKKSLRRVHRMAKRETIKAQCLDPKNPEITSEDLLMHSVGTGMLGYLITKSSHIERQKMEKKINNSGIPPEQDYHSFKGS